MCDRLPLKACQLSPSKPAPGGCNIYRVKYCTSTDQLLFFPVALNRRVDNNSPTEIEKKPDPMKELEQVSPESPVRPSTSGLEPQLEIPKKAASDPGIQREKFRNIDTICASLPLTAPLPSSSSHNQFIGVSGLFKQPTHKISQNGSKDSADSPGRYSPIHQQNSPCVSPLFQDQDMEYLSEQEEDSLPNVGEESCSDVPDYQEDCNSPFTIQEVRSLSRAEDNHNSNSVPDQQDRLATTSMVLEDQESTEECASACSSTTDIGPGSTGSSTVINSPADSNNLPESPMTVEEDLDQGIETAACPVPKSDKELCLEHGIRECYIPTKIGIETAPSPVPKSDKELCLQHGFRECYIPTQFIKIPSLRTHALKTWSKKHLSKVIERSKKEIRRKVVKSDLELCHQYRIRECYVRIRPFTIETVKPFTVHYSRSYIAHVIRTGYNEQLHRKRVDWDKVYDKYLAGRCVKLRREYFRKIAQESVDDYLTTREIIEAREERKRLILKKETENFIKEGREKEARERRAKLIRMKETEILKKKRVYYEDGEYVLADCEEDAVLFSEAVRRAKRLKVTCVDR